MIKVKNPAIRNNLVKMFNTNKNMTVNDISRLGSVEQRNTTYRRNGILNFGARQMLALSGDLDFYSVGVGGPPIVG